MEPSRNMIVAVLVEQQLGLICEQGRPSLLERASSPPHPGPEERSPNQVSLRRGTKTCFEGFVGGANFDRTWAQRLRPQVQVLKIDPKTRSH